MNVDALVGEVLVRCLDVFTAEGNVIEAGIFLPRQLVDLQDDAARSGDQHLGRSSMMIRPVQQLEAHLLVEGDEFLHVADDEFDVVNSDDHAFAPVCANAIIVDNRQLSGACQCGAGKFMTFDLPKKRSLSDLVFEEIERLILDGVLKPGEPVNEKAFSDHNGLSRAPIREACRKLEQAGLVEIVVNRGVFVKRISRRTAAELCDIRLVLATHAARLAAERINEGQLKVWSQTRGRNREGRNRS